MRRRDAGSTSTRAPYIAVAMTALTHFGCGMYASSSRRRYASFHSSKMTTPASVARPERGHAPPRGFVVRVREEGGELHLRAGNELERRLRRDAERSLVTHEQVLELEPGRRLPELATAAVTDLDQLAGREHEPHADHEVARVPVAAADQRPPARPDPAADDRARIRGRVVRVDDAVLPELLVQLQHVDPGLDGDRPVLEVELEDPVHELHVDDDAAAERNGSVRQPRATGPR